MKILVADEIAEKAIEKLKEEFEVIYSELSYEALLEEIVSYDALIVRSRTRVTKEVIQAGENLKVIGRAGVGVDNIDVREASERKIIVVNAPISSTISVAELTFAHMLALARNLTKADKTTKEGKWEKKSLMGIELNEKTLGLIGLGRIGSEVAKRARAFGMKCIAYDPYLTKEKVREMGVEPVTLNTLLRDSDFITIHATLTKETKYLIGAKELAKMKSSAFLINCARGSIVDEKALYKVLRDKKIAGCALDVFEVEPPKDSPLLKLDNVIFTPHLGASTKEAQEKAGTIVAEQVLKVLKREKPDFCVNPEVLNN
ncbi:MAG: hydroxyacid dehydrogenase [Candidatus Thermoplasmatota archaeon]|nr:hydroxyacid dehydrogenase [Candidatus Thermoplasmatota archaeon]